MNNNSTPVIDNSGLLELEQKLKQLENTAKTKVLYSSLIKGAKILLDATKLELRKSMGDAAINPIRKRNGNEGTWKPLIDGIRMSGDKPYCEVKVHIMGHGFLRWFEKGTQLRRTQSGANRGAIKALNFFFNAKESNKTNIENAITANLDKEINKILN